MPGTIAATAPAGSRRLEVLLLAGALAAWVLVAYHRVALLGETWVDRDALLIAQPSSDFLASSLRQGRIPQWADWVGLGVPFAPNPLHGALYPPFWLAALVAGPAGRDLVVLVHLVIAAWGAAALAWRLGARGLGAFVAGALFATCGYVASMPPNNSAHLLAWIPWVAWAADRVACWAGERGRAAEGVAALGFAAALAAQLAVGEPAHAITAGLVALGVALARARRRLRALAWLGAGMVGAAALAAAPLLPAARVVGWSNRAGGVAGATATWWWMSPARLVELAWPNALGPPHSLFSNLARVVADSMGQGGLLQGPTWSFSLYLGIPALVLAAWACREESALRLLPVALALGLVAMGPLTPVHEALRTVLPLARLARYPEKHVVGAFLVLAALAGAGFTAAFARGPGPPDRRLALGAWLAAAALAVALAGLALGRSALAGALGPAARRVPYPLDLDAGLRFALASGVAALAAAAAFGAAAQLRGRLPRPAALAAGALVAGAPAIHAAMLTRTVPRQDVERAPPLVAAIPRPGPPALRPRVVTAPLDMQVALRDEDAVGEWTLARPALDLPALHGVAVLPGDDSLTGAAFFRFQQLEGRLFPFASLLGAEFLLVESAFAARAGLRVVESDARWRGSLVRSPGPRPRAFVAPRWRHVADPLGAWVGAPRDDGRVFLPGSAGDSPAAAESVLPRPCQARSPWPEQVELTCVAERDAYAVLLDSAAPGWTVRVDGAAAPIEEAEGLFRAVRIPPGRHQVVFEYRTPGLALGAAISLAAWTAWAAALLALRRR